MYNWHKKACRKCTTLPIKCTPSDKLQAPDSKLLCGKTLSAFNGLINLEDHRKNVILFNIFISKS